MTFWYPQSCMFYWVLSMNVRLQLCRFLVMDPNKRITSEQAMMDTYFSEDPKPCQE